MRYRDELVKNLVAMESKIVTLKNAVQRRFPVEDFLATLDDLERLRELVADAIDREPVEGYEVNESARRR
jgi:hypothetical protein